MRAQKEPVANRRTDRLTICAPGRTSGLGPLRGPRACSGPRSRQPTSASSTGCARWRPAASAAAAEDDKGSDAKSHQRQAARLGNGRHDQFLARAPVERKPAGADAWGCGKDTAHGQVGGGSRESDHAQVGARRAYRRGKACILLCVQGRKIRGLRRPPCCKWLCPRMFRGPEAAHR